MNENEWKIDNENWDVIKDDTLFIAREKKAIIYKGKTIVIEAKRMIRNKTKLWEIRTYKRNYKTGEFQFYNGYQLGNITEEDIKKIIEATKTLEKYVEPIF
jgi:hypothetical protein